MSSPHPSLSEFDEVSAERTSDDARSVARELFAHSLLHAQACSAREGRHGQERRVQAVLTRLRDERESGGMRRTPEPVAGSLGWQRFAWIAAAVLVLGLAVAYWPDSRMTPAWADALADRALADAAKTAHVYDIEIRYELRGKPHRSRWEAALGTDKQFHIKLVEGEVLPAGIEFGSDGKTLWARSRVGQAFELPMHDPSLLPWASVGSELAYYELRPFLESSHGDLQLRVLEIRKGEKGRRVVLGGEYHREDRRRWGRGRRSKTTIKIAGEVRVEVDEQSGQLMRIYKTQRRVAAETEKKTSGRPSWGIVPVSFDLVRRGPVSATTSEFEFDPPRVRTHPMNRVMAWFGAIGRSTLEALRRKRAREAHEKTREKDGR